jgi:uncharacterized protein (TIGR02147 family)
MKILRLFEFDSYKQFVLEWVKNQPKQGRGQFRKMSEELGLSTVMVSQIFSGDREISVDHAFKLASFLNLADPEKRYLLLLVERERAGTTDLKDFLTKQIKTLRQESLDLKKVISQETELSDAVKARLHSNWIYSAVRLQSSIPETQTVEAIAQTLKLPIEEVRQVIDFLVEHRLMTADAGVVQMGPQRTHLEKTSPYILTRQKTWRVKGFERMDHRVESDLFYTGPMSLSSKLAGEIRRELTDQCKSISDRLVKETPETLFCLNIDFFRI